MEKQYDDTNRGSLFVNDRKEKETQPDYTGMVNVGGVEYRLSAWKMISKGGLKYMSLAVSKKTEMGTAPQRPAAPARQAPREEFNDDVPF